MISIPIASNFSQRLSTRKSTSDDKQKDDGEYEDHDVEHSLPVANWNFITFDDITTNIKSDPLHSGTMYGWVDEWK